MQLSNYVLDYIINYAPSEAKTAQNGGLIHPIND